MDSTERTRRLNLLREGLETNDKVLDNAISSLLCRLSLVTQEVFYELVPSLPKNIENSEDYEYNSDDASYDYDNDLTDEEYNLIKNKILDMIRGDIVTIREIK